MWTVGGLDTNPCFSPAASWRDVLMFDRRGSHAIAKRYRVHRVISRA
jgi:hypothetical protein